MFCELLAVALVVKLVKPRALSELNKSLMEEP